MAARPRFLGVVTQWAWWLVSFGTCVPQILRVCKRGRHVAFETLTRTSSAKASSIHNPVSPSYVEMRPQ